MFPSNYTHGFGPPAPPVSKYVRPLQYCAAIQFSPPVVDATKLKLHEAVQRGEPWAVCFTLKCLAKDRGYVERQERTEPTGQPLSGERHNTVIVAGGSKAEYIAKLNDAREMIRGAGKSASRDGAFGAGPGDGHGAYGTAPRQGRRHASHPITYGELRDHSHRIEPRLHRESAVNGGARDSIAHGLGALVGVPEPF
jgi:hypothetical protein